MKQTKSHFELTRDEIKKYVDTLDLDTERNKELNMRLLFWDNQGQFGIGLMIENHSSLIKIHLVYHNKVRQTETRICSLLISNEEIHFCSFATGVDILCAQELGEFLDKNFEPVTGKELFSAYFVKTKPTDIKMWKNFKMLVLDKLKQKTKNEI